MVDSRNLRPNGRLSESHEKVLREDKPPLGRKIIRPRKARGLRGDKNPFFCEPFELHGAFLEIPGVTFSYDPLSPN